MRPSKPIAAVLIAAHVLMIGCSASTPRITPVADVEQVSNNRDVALELNSGHYVAGKFKGTDTLAAADYAAIYELRRVDDSGTPRLPALGPVTVLFDADGEVQGELVGFEPVKLHIQQPQAAYPSFLGYERVTAVIDANGDRFEGPLLRQLVAAGQVPTLSQVRLEVDGSERLFGAERIRAVHWAEGGGTSVGTIAVVLGIAAIAILALTDDEDPTPPPAPEYSCPYFYSWDGNSWVMEAELFGGSLVAAAQRTDTAGLRHADTSSGELRLRMTNELNETQFVDRVGVRAIDHPIGTMVAAAEDGTPVVFRDLVAPTAARTLAGRDVTTMVKAEDGHTWSGTPRAEASLANGRDGLIVEFPHPGGDTLELALRLRNTAWGSWLQGHMNTLLGVDPQPWFHVMESSPAARERWEEAALREAMLRVQLATPSGWQTLDHVWEVGPTAFRSRAVRLDVSGATGPTLRLRLDATAGLWEIDSIVAASPSASPAAATELQLLRAHTPDGVDLRTELATTDGSRHMMERFRADSELVFAVPAPPEPGMARTYLLDATGYYRIHTQGSGAPQTELLTRLLEEPGAFASYANELWGRATVAALTDMGRAESW